MTRQFDIDRAFEDWLSEGPSQLPQHAIDGIVRQLNETDQWRPIWLPGRKRMNRIMLGAGGLAAVLVLTLVGAGLFLSLNSTAPGVGGEPPPTAAQSPATQSPTASPAPTFPSSGEKDGHPCQALEAGPYRASIGTVPVTVTVPNGWHGLPWIPADELNRDGLHVGSGDCLIQTDPVKLEVTSEAETPEAVTAALAAQEGHETGPTDVTLAGYAASRFEFSVPGQTATVYVVDVDGSTLVVAATRDETSVPADVAELDAVVASLRFGP